MGLTFSNEANADHVRPEGPLVASLPGSDWSAAGRPLPVANYDDVVCLQRRPPNRMTRYFRRNQAAKEALRRQPSPHRRCPLYPLPVVSPHVREHDKYNQRDCGTCRHSLFVNECGARWLEDVFVVLVSRSWCQNAEGLTPFSPPRRPISKKGTSSPACTQTAADGGVSGRRGD